MAALHAALQKLGPIDYSTVPLNNLDDFFRENLISSQLLVESVPISQDSGLSPVPSRPRSNTTTSSGSNNSSASSSSVKSAPPAPEHAALQKEWGKPIKLAAKDNPLGMSVYKMSSKDGKGAWFARRSIHEGLDFRQWKRSMEQEFPESLEVQGGPGEGNIRGIGGEKRVEHEVVEGIGNIDVYHLSAQFPGPTAPRDFVTLLLSTDNSTSSKASDQDSPDEARSNLADTPQHYMAISKPCTHPDCPPRDGFIRGQYESIEFIREIPMKPAKKTSRSSNDLVGASLRVNTFPPADGSDERSNNTEQSNASKLSPNTKTTGRPRGKTTSFVEKPIPQDKGCEDPHAQNPVEWIMITRSDPGGNVPRWLVERGTPGSIVADAGKFLAWACEKDHDSVEKAKASDSEKSGKADAPQAHYSPSQPTTQPQPSSAVEVHDVLHSNGHLAGLENKSDSLPQPPTHSDASAPTASNYLYSMTSAVGAGIASLTPAMISDRLPLISHSPKPSSSSTANGNSLSRVSSINSSSDSVSSTLSYETATSFRKPQTHNIISEGPGELHHLSAAEQTTSNAQSVSTDGGVDLSISATSSQPSDPELSKAYSKLMSRLQELDSKLSKARGIASAAEASKLADSNSKESKELAKAEERDKRERSKAQERYEKEGKKVRERRERNSRKEAEKAKRAKEKEVKDKLAEEVERLKKERDALRIVVGELQRENTELVAKLGRAEGVSSVSTSETNLSKAPVAIVEPK